MKIEIYDTDELRPWSQRSGKGKGDGESDVSEIGKEQDEIHKDIEQKLNQRKDTSGKEQEREPTDSDTSRRKRKKDDPGTAAMGDLESREDEIKNLRSRISWQAMMRKMFQSAGQLFDTSYTKPHRRNVSGMEIARQTGAAAIKPGVKTLDQPVVKILLAFDTSGSMYEDIPQVLAEARKLLRLLNKQSDTIAVVFWSGTDAWFQCDMKANTYAKISDISELKSPMTKKDTEKDINKLLSKGADGGTIFSSKLASACNQLAIDGWNIMIFSDDDILAGDNRERFIQLWETNKSKIFFIANDDNTWRSACAAVGAVPPTWAHL
jgi:Mg-chelatase subunit ChlD